MLSSALAAPQVCSTFSACCLLHVTFSQLSFGKKTTTTTKNNASAAFDPELVKMRFVALGSSFVAVAQVVSSPSVLLLTSKPQGWWVAIGCALTNTIGRKDASFKTVIGGVFLFNRCSWRTVILLIPERCCACWDDLDWIQSWITCADPTWG